jgi:hypothetical protein
VTCHAFRFSGIVAFQIYLMLSDVIDLSADVIEERCSKWLAITVRQI